MEEAERSLRQKRKQMALAQKKLDKAHKKAGQREEAQK